jgi:hypothetical protein
MQSYKAFGQTVRNDTVFLLEKYYPNGDGKPWYHAVFIDTNKKSRFYDQISDFNMNEYHQSHYNWSVENLREKKIALTKRKITGLPLRWIILYQYKGNFYTYKPSEFSPHLMVNITDTAFIDKVVEGPVANKIIDFTQTDDKTFQFKLTGAYAQNRTLIIHIIDNKNGIAVFEDSYYRFGEEEKRFYLMISADKIKNLPIIVNYCAEMRTNEFDFDEPDFDKLLNK